MNIAMGGTEELSFHSVLAKSIPYESCSYLMAILTTRQFQGEFTPDVPAIRKLCDRYNAWMHIDGGLYSRNESLQTIDFSPYSISQPLEHLRGFPRS